MAANRKSTRTLAVLVLALTQMGSIARGESDATVCQLLGRPTEYSGEMVKMRVEIVEPRRVQLTDPADPSCGRIPWMFPNNPDVRPKAQFTLIEDEKLAQLRSSLGLLLTPPPDSDRRPSRIFALVVGRFDSVFEQRNGASVRTKKHLGYLGADEHVFVLKQVLDLDIRTPSSDGDR